MFCRKMKNQKFLKNVFCQLSKGEKIKIISFRYIIFAIKKQSHHSFSSEEKKKNKKIISRT